MYLCYKSLSLKEKKNAKKIEKKFILPSISRESRNSGDKISLLHRIDLPNIQVRLSGRILSEE